MQRLAAFRANHDRIEQLAALLVFMQQRPAALHHMDAAPMHQRHHDQTEVETFLGSGIFIAPGGFLVGNTAQSPHPQFLQALGQQVAREPNADWTPSNRRVRKKHFPQDGKRPAIADHTDGAGKGAGLPPVRPISFPLSVLTTAATTDPERSTKVLNKNELSGYGSGCNELSVY